MEKFPSDKFLTKGEKCKFAMSLNTTKEKITYYYKYMRQQIRAKERLSQG